MNGTQLRNGRRVCGGVRGAVRKPRRGVIVVKSAILMAVMMSFVGLAMDTGAIVRCKNGLQTAVDAAALAAAQEITSTVADAGEQGTGETRVDAQSVAVGRARAIAAEVAELNGVFVDPLLDVRFGRRDFVEASGRWEIAWDAEPYNVVGVNARRTNDDLTQPDAKLRLAFGWALGKPAAAVIASATAFVEARDLVMVMDFSGSMNVDSTFYPSTLDKLGQAAVENNLHEIWQDLGAPLYGALPYTPDYVTVARTPANIRWIGATVQVSFNQTASEVRLVYSNGVEQVFTGGSAGQVRSYQGTGAYASRVIYTARVKVGTATTSYTFYNNSTIKQALGLTNVPYPYPAGSWDSYINYMRDSTSFNDAQLDRVGHRRKFGLMTLVEFWLKCYMAHDETPDLWKTRHYPFHSIKEGNSLLCDFLGNLEFGDYVGLVSYDAEARVESLLDEPGMPYVNLGGRPITNDYEAIDTIMLHKQAGHYGGSTNTGGGLAKALELLDAHRRVGAQPTVLLMTDGLANARDASWAPPASWDWSTLTDYDGDGDADYSTTDLNKLYVVDMAIRAKTQGVTIHTLGVGADADRNLMRAIAFIGGGVWLDVPGGATVSTMQDDVLAAFRQMASTLPPPKLIDATPPLATSP